jgi:hypothetical protein
MSSMANPASTKDPLIEHDHLTSELASLERQFADRKLGKDEFEVLSKQLKEKIRRAESEAYGMARKEESIAKRLRLRNYNDPEVQQVMNHFIRTGGKTLAPEFGSDRLPRYPVANESSDNIMLVDRPLLQKMADIGIVEESLFERILYCPRCSTPSDVYLRFKCTQCGSIDISISRMIEHLACGTIHQESAFRVGKSLICPTCKKLLERDEEYRLIGVVCSCNVCKAHFEDPVQSFFCRKCNGDFDLPRAMIIDVYAYSMTKDALIEASRFLGVNTLTKVLAEKGLDVKSPGVLMGPSKEVVFSVVVRKEAKVIAVDISQSDLEVDIEPVLEMYVKLLEVNPTVAVFGAVPRLSKRAIQMASLHKILVAEGTTPMDLASKVLGIVEGT